MHDDTGLMSIDFIAGFTIFMIAFIIVVTMSSGLLVGLRSKTIDYDAVAYRTGVILAEDPGEGNTFDKEGRKVPTDSASWELIPLSPKEDNPDPGTHEYLLKDISRMGLSVPKMPPVGFTPGNVYFQQRNPNILSQAKVNRFFDKSLFYDYDRPDPFNPLNTVPNDYRKKVIFGDYPYKFNITLDSINQEDSIHKAVGDPDWPTANYGYIRRVVMVKDPAANFTAPPSPKNSSQMNITIDFNNLYNISSPRGPIYQTDPNKEEIAINLSGFDNVNYTSQLNQIKLKSINISRFDNLSMEYSDLVIYESDPTVKIYLNATSPNESRRWIPGINNESVISNILIIFEPGYFSKTTGGQAVYTSQIFVHLNFDDTVSPANNVGQGSEIPYQYAYSSTSGIGSEANPKLKPCILEVRIW